MKPPPTGDLGAVHPLDSGLRDVQHDLVIEDRCAVQHPTQPEPGVLDRPYETFGRVWGVDVSGDDFDAHPVGVKLRYVGHGLGVRARPPVDHHESGTLLCQPAGCDEADTAHAAHHDV